MLLLELVHPGNETDSYLIITKPSRPPAVEQFRNPNLQNIPIRTEEGREIRSAFVPRDGWRLLSADYSQIELRILAHCSEDPILIQAFEKDEDIHGRTAAEVFQVFPSLCNTGTEAAGQGYQFSALSTGMSPFGLSRQLGNQSEDGQNPISTTIFPATGASKPSWIAPSSRLVRPGRPVHC